jgi:uncharacterized coiled-coil protein SlyX
MNPLSSERQKLESKIAFLQQQLDSLDHYLPETYQFLMEQMDSQQVLLKRLEVHDHFAAIDSSEVVLSPCSALENT